MPSTVDVHTLAGAYALDAVDDLERVAFERHLRACPTCADEVAELRETVGWLTHPVAVSAPPRMRDAVLARVAGTPQERSKRATPAARANRGRWRSWAASAVAASLLAVGVGVGTWGVAEQRIRDVRLQNARVDAVLSAPDARLVRQETSGGRISLVVSASRDAAVAVLDGLPSPGDDKVYQLWMIGGSGAVPVGMLPVEAGSGRAYVQGLGGATEFGVSREPVGGSPQPTMSEIVGRLTF